MDQLNDKYYGESILAINQLIDLKIAVHKLDKVLDDKIEDFNARLGALDGNNEALKTEN